MRIWLVNPEFMCRQHLLGEHNEIHKLIGAMKKFKNLDGYFEKGLLELNYLSVSFRHNDLAVEMINRGYKHNSPLNDYNGIRRKYAENYKGDIYMYNRIDKEKNQKELFERCKNCKQRYKNFNKE